MKSAVTIRPLATSLAIGITCSISAFTYNPGDVILVFRKNGANDVEFNLGSLDRFLQATNGAVITVANWDPNLVTANYLFSDDGVEFALVAATTVNATNRGVWLSNAEPNGAPLDRTPSQWQQIWSKVDAVGNKLAEYTGTNATPSLAVSPSLYPSYTYITSNGGSAPGLITKLGGTSSFTLESGIPGMVKFYEVRPSTLATKPSSLLLGSFQLGLDGTLIYTAAGATVAPPVLTQILSVASVSGGYRVAFKTVAGTHYRLRYTGALGSSPGTWTQGADNVVGTGGEASLDDLTPDGAQRFYAIESY